MGEMAGVGARRGALCGAVLAALVPVHVVGVSGGPSPWGFLETLVLLVAVLGAGLGAVCGSVAGHVLDDAGTWRQAAARSSVTAAVMVLAVSWAATGLTVGLGLLALAAPLALGASALATWQSWAMGRRVAARRRAVRRPAAG